MLSTPPQPDSCISVNLSARLLQNEHFANRLLERLVEGEIHPQNLIVEITEDSLSQDVHIAARNLMSLKELGVRIALDDFGTGQSSLNHLRYFPFDLVKIDRTFVHEITEDPNDAKLVQAIIQLSHALDMQVVGEGVETEQQRAFLRKEGCDFAQGYLIGRPHAVEYYADAIELTGIRKTV